MEQNRLSKQLLYLMAGGAGLVVANNYYNQPLLSLIAGTFGASESEVSRVPLFTQLGYAFGLLFIIPLGDKFPRKKLILLDFIAIILSLLLAAVAPSLLVLSIASFCVGFSSVVPQLFVPMAAQLAEDKDRGRTIGIVMSGLLIGILGSRILSGFVGEHLGWRSMYFIATGLMLVYWILLKIKLPELFPHFKGTYSELMKSLLFYFSTESSVRLAAIRGGLAFAGFSAFWTTLVFLMEASFGYGSGAAGAFGALGIVGALAAGLAGRLSDRLNKNRLISLSTVVIIIAWLVFLFSGSSLAGLIVGVIFIDMGLQALHITNQNIIFSKNSEARNRINTIYMVGYFLGGALGTVTGAYAWEMFKWQGVASLGFCYSVLIIIFHLLLKEPVREGGS